MRIAIIGSGNMGGALGRAFAHAGHSVAFSYSRSDAKLRALARSSGPRARAASSIADAIREADAVLLAVHWSHVPNVLRAATNLRGKVLIDCTNPMTDDDSALAVGHGDSGGEIVARRAAEAHVVKAFNTVPSELLAAGANALTEAADVCYCGNNEHAKSIVAGLIRDIGFEPVDCGALSIARYLEPFALLVAELAYNHGKRPELGVRFVRARRKPAKRRSAKKRR